MSNESKCISTPVHWAILRSLSEKLFIEQRLIAHKVPFLMIVITKLDLVKENERAEVINYIKSKLQTLKVDIPIYLADEENTFQDFDVNYAGIERIKEQIVLWKNDPERIKRTEQSMAAKAFSLLKTLKDILDHGHHRAHRLAGLTDGCRQAIFHLYQRRCRLWHPFHHA